MDKNSSRRGCAGHAKRLGFVAIIAVAAACSPRATSEQDPSREANASAKADTTSLPFEWPIPQGWRSETIPFPLDFAPRIPYAGLEEIRFAPGMFKPDSADFWTYAFVWWLHGDVQFDAETLNAQLAEYYEGLSLAVEDTAGFDSAEAKVVSRLARDSAGALPRWQGTLSTYEPFATHARIDLNVDVEVFRCEHEDRTVGMFLVSPQPRGHAVWSELAALRTVFECSRR